MDEFKRVDKSKNEPQSRSLTRIIFELYVHATLSSLCTVPPRQFTAIIIINWLS